MTKNDLIFGWGLLLLVAFSSLGYLIYMGERYIEVYTDTDILYVYPLQNKIELESKVEILSFRDFAEMREWIADETADIFDRLVISDDRDYPDDCMDLFSGSVLIGRFCPVDSSGTFKFEPL